MKLMLPGLLALLLLSCGEQRAQGPAKALLTGGPCEGCEAIFEFGSKQLSATDTLPGYETGGEKLRVSGTVYKPDGKTPAPGVVLYVYHTDSGGIYPKRGDETGWGQRHGYFRGWIKTGPDGRYSFYTSKPGTYPSRAAPAHIHLTVLEPDGKYYYLADYIFEGDPLITERDLHRHPRGGHNGVLQLTSEGGHLHGTRDIILGRNVPGYPGKGK